MECRQPSSAIASSHNNVRRRSSALSPSVNPTSPTILHSPNPYQSSLTVPLEDDDTLTNYSQPTILLVPPSHPVDPPPSLPAFSPPVSQGRTSGQIDDRKATDNQKSELFSSVPLTPRLAAVPRETSEISLQSSPPSSLHMSRLPSPDFASGNRNEDARSSLFPHALSFLSFNKRPAINLGSSTSLISSECTRSARSDSTGLSGSRDSIVSRSSCASSSSFDTGHLSLIPSIGTTEKFTHKWPKPQSIRSQSITKDITSSGTTLNEVAAALEDGEGLGMNKIDRWTPHKWCLLLSASMVFAYGAGGLICAIETWFRTWNQADVMNVADGDILILITLASSILLFTSLMGFAGALLNSRPILAIYALLLWPALIAILSVGYTSYKRYAFALDQKLNFAWSQYYTPLGRLLIQNSLSCCGYYDALHEGVSSGKCYPRTPLPGCKGKLYRFERTNLATIWSAAFALVPLHLVSLFAALLCANHMTRTFGKGIMPKKYRLSGVDVRADAEKILKGIGEGSVIVRPELSRASSSAIFREDKLETLRKVRLLA